MNIACIINKKEIWLPQHVPANGTFAYFNPEDNITPHGFVIPASNLSLYHAECLDYPNPPGGMTDLYLLRKDKKLARVLQSSNLSIRVEYIPLQDTYTVIGTHSDTSRFTAAIATELFRTGHFKTVQEFLESHRANFQYNPKLSLYRIDDIVEKLEAPKHFTNLKRLTINQRQN